MLLRRLIFVNESRKTIKVNFNSLVIPWQSASNKSKFFHFWKNAEVEEKLENFSSLLLFLYHSFHSLAVFWRRGGQDHNQVISWKIVSRKACFSMINTFQGISFCCFNVKEISEDLLDIPKQNLPPHSFRSLFSERAPPTFQRPSLPSHLLLFYPQP